MEINLKSNIDEFIKNIETKYIRQIPFTISKALNTTKKIVYKDLQYEIKKSFDKPVPVVFSANDGAIVMSEDSTKTNLAISLKIRNEDEGTINWGRILSPHIEGGQRKRKRSEHLLYERGKGFLEGKSQTIVGKSFTDSFGNLRSSEYNKLLSTLGAQFDPTANTPTGKRNKGKVRTTDYFSTALRNKKTKHLEVGIYKRSGDKITPILLFTKAAAKYRKRFRFYEVANQSIDKNFANEFVKAFQYAVSTAK